MTNNNDFNDDDLARRLSSLGDDLGPVRLPGPAAARKRAAQRSRNQVLGSVVAGVMVAASVVVFRSAAVPPENTEPAQTPSETPSVTITASDNPSPEPVTISDEALMRAEDIYDEWPDTVPDATWAETSVPDTLPECLPDRRFDLVKQISFTNTDAAAGAERQITQTIVRVDDAADQFALLRSEISACAESPQGVGDILDAGEQAWVVRYVEPSGEGAWVTISVIQEQDAISLIAKREIVHDQPEQVDWVTPAQAADRMCDAIFESGCVGNAAFAPVGDGDNSPPASDPGSDPSSDPSQPSDDPTLQELADEPFLTEADINPVGYGGGRFSQNPSHEPHEWDRWCLDDPNGFAGSVARTTYFVAEAEGYVAETVIQFSDATTAGGWIDDYTSIEQRCAAMGVEIEPDESVGGVREINQFGFTSAGDATALGWELLGDGGPETDTFYAGAGVAVQGNIGVILRFYAMSPPDNWEGYVRSHLGTALDRAIAD